MNHIEQFLRGLAVVLLIFAIVAPWLAPLFVVQYTDNPQWFWLYLPLMAVLVYLMGDLW